MTDRRTLLDKIRALDFVLLESGMFLNGTPCEEALAYFEKMRQERCAAVEEYEKAYGPLTMTSGAENGTWCWTKGPWPWESEAN